MKTSILQTQHKVALTFWDSDFGFLSDFGFRISDLFLIASALVGLSLPSTHAATLSDDTLARISFEQKLNAQVSLDLPFRDETGHAARLGDYFGRKPVILVLGYYECPMLCTLVLNGLTESLQDLKWTIGKEFDVVNVSINPRELPALAAAKKHSYLTRYGRSGAARGWHFLTGDEPAIRRLADEVGFQFAYDTQSRQYAHPSGLIVLTPNGKVAQYMFGVSFAPQTLYASLKAASSNQVGSPIQKFILLCFHYNPITGKYGAAIMLTVRLLSVATVGGLAWLVFTLVRRDKQPLAHTTGLDRQPAAPVNNSGNV